MHDGIPGTWGGQESREMFEDRDGKWGESKTKSALSCPLFVRVRAFFFSPCVILRRGRICVLLRVNTPAGVHKEHAHTSQTLAHCSSRRPKENRRTHTQKEKAARKQECERGGDYFWSNHLLLLLWGPEMILLRLRRDLIWGEQQLHAFLSLLMEENKSSNSCEVFCGIPFLQRMAEGGGGGGGGVWREEFLMQEKRDYHSDLSGKVTEYRQWGEKLKFVWETQRAATCDPLLLQVGQQNEKTCGLLNRRSRTSSVHPFR